MKRFTKISVLSLCLALGLGASTAGADTFGRRNDPPARRDVRVAHRPGFVFVQGSWAWQQRRWVWMPGHYERVKVGFGRDHRNDRDHRDDRDDRDHRGGRNDRDDRGPRDRDHRDDRVRRDDRDHRDDRGPRDDRNHHRSEEHTSELQSHHDLVCRLLLEKKKKKEKKENLYITKRGQI